MKYTIYRGSEVVVADVEIQGSVTEKIMGEETASLTFSAYDKIDFHIGDKITIFGRDYFLQEDPINEKVNSRLYNYTLTFYSLKYTLADTILFFHDENNELTIPDFDLMGNASTCLDLIISNLNADPLNDGWTKGTVDDTEVKLISFSSINCLEAISKLAEEFELEYWIDSDKSIHFTERKPVSGYSFAYGKAQGLRNIKRSILDGGSLCTRLYVKGGTQNLPKNYRSGQKNLRIDVPYLEKNVNIYGRKSHIETFEDIYPKYEGTVTAVSSTDPNIFTDANLNFDLNAYNEYGTTVLKAGVTAKIIFQTGQLAGYTIELLEAGGFNSATKTFYLNRVKDEADIVVPSELLRPAVGDKYIIVDIMMPEAYVLAAESLLKTKAQEYLDKNSRERFQYAVVSDPFYFEAQNVNIPLGSTVHFIDSDFGLDDDLRVIGKRTNVQDRYSVELELSEETQVSSIVKSYYEQQKRQNTIINNLKYNAEQARRNYLFGREFHDKVFDGEDYFKAENIKPLSIETKMLSLGSRLQQFGLPGVSFKIENNNALINTSGKIVHQTINPDAVREWNISANSVTGISDNFNYIFIKCQRVGTNASFVVSETPIKVEADADFYHFEVGYLSSIIDGYRKIKTTYGFAQLNPAELSIGRIADPSGNNFIELKEDGIDISAKVIFKSGSSGYENLTDKPDLSSFEETRDYVNSTLQTDLDDLKNRADGVIESWFYSHTPTLSNLPAINWVTTEERNAHIGDTFTNMQEFVDNVTTPDAGKAWRFVKNETTGEFSWSLIANSDSTKALIEAGKAKDTADAKRRVFVSQPYPPYNVGDLWVQGNGGDIMRCKFERLSGSYVATDFEKASKYTDDTAVNNLQIGGRNYFAKNNLEYGARSIITGQIVTSSNTYIRTKEPISLEENKNYILSTINKGIGNWTYDILLIKWDETFFGLIQTGKDASFFVPQGVTMIHINIRDNGNPLNLEWFNANINIKLEKGTKATDWTPAPEDIDAKISEEAQKVIDLEQKTDFLTGTTTEGNAVATGTLLVGNSEGTNAGITGIGDEDEIFLWGGSTFANRNNAKVWLKRNGHFRFMSPNGLSFDSQTGTITNRYLDTAGNPLSLFMGTNSSGNPEMTFYDRSGNITFRMNPNGIDFPNEVPESWTSVSLKSAGNTITRPLDSTTRAQMINTIKTSVCYNGTMGIYAIKSHDLIAYDYFAGRTAYSEGYRQYEGLKTSNNSRTSNIADGWYYNSSDQLMTDFATDEPLLELFYISGGKKVYSEVLKLPKYGTTGGGYSYNPCS